MQPHELVETVCDALTQGELGADALTARHLGQHLGKTTSVLYHHFGSLDGFLFAVAQAGFGHLGARLAATLKAGRSLEDVAEAFVTFGLDRPALYHLMFEKRYDWEALRDKGVLQADMPGLGVWSALVGFFAGAGSEEPESDARLLYAGVHGLVSLAASGRANVGDRSVSDRRAAIASARRLARRLLAPAPPSLETCS